MTHSGQNTLNQRENGFKTSSIVDLSTRIRPKLGFIRPKPGFIRPKLGLIRPKLNLIQPEVISTSYPAAVTLHYNLKKPHTQFNGYAAVCLFFFSVDP